MPLVWRIITDNASSEAVTLKKHLKNTQRAVWRSIWLSTVESETIAISVLLHALTHTIWGDFWKHSREKSNICNQCEYAYLLACHLRRHLKTYGGKSQTNAINVTLHQLGQTVWGHIWKYTKSNKCNQCNFVPYQAGSLRKHLKTHSGEKFNRCILAGISYWDLHVSTKDHPKITWFRNNLLSYSRVKVC